MLFSEPAFLFFFLPFLLVAYFCVWKGARNVVLLLASLLFYAWGEKLFVFILLASVAFNYAVGLWVERAHGTRSAKASLAAAVAGNLGLIIAYKYANFLVDNLNLLLAAAGRHPIHLAPVHLPIGISFFTFQALSYVIDVYRRDAQAQKNPLTMALYIALFPQLIAGPIVRYHYIASQLVRRVVTRDGFAAGIRRFIIGLGKKMIIANTVGACADQIFAIPASQLTTGVAWLGAICYTLQIYFDFCGYSDMAIGLGRMFGFRFPENFNYPYLSASIREFWRRWHISLSTWFRDYVYIPLGGNRRRPARVYFNLVTVFFLCGLWHGASWTFVIWGLLHGVFLVLERLGPIARWASRSTPLNHLYALLVVVFAWVFFRADTLGQALSFTAAMAGAAQGSGLDYNWGMYLNRELALVLVAGIIGSFPVLPALGRVLARVRDAVPGPGKPVMEAVYASAEIAGLGAILLGCSMFMAAGTYNPFIYFRF